MPFQGAILALDLATTFGWASGTPGSGIVASGSMRLKRPDDEHEKAPRNMGRWLRDRFRMERFDFVAVEAPMPAGAPMDGQTSGVAAALQWEVHGALQAICGVYRIPVFKFHVQTVRKHFTGRARWDGRDQAKAETIKRCHALGLMPSDCRDDNRADALAVFCLAASRHCGVEVGGLRLGAAAPPDASQVFDDAV